MPALAPVEPVGIIKGATTHSQDLREALQLEANRGGAPGAEVQGDTLAARIGAVRIALRADAVESHVLPSEDWFDQKGRAGKALAESAMTNCDAHGLRARLVADIAAQAATLVHNGHGELLQSAPRPDRGARGTRAGSGRSAF